MLLLFIKHLKDLAKHEKAKLLCGLFLVLSLLYLRSIGIIGLLLTYVLLMIVLYVDFINKLKQADEKLNEWIVNFSERTLLAYVGNLTLEEAVVTTFNDLRFTLAVTQLSAIHHMQASMIIHKLTLAISSDRTRQLLSLIDQSISDGNDIEQRIHYAWIQEMLLIKRQVIKSKMQQLATLVAVCNLIIFLGMMLMMMLPSMMQLLTI